MARWAFTSAQSGKMEGGVSPVASAKAESADKETTKGTSRQRLTKALDGDDPLASAARTLTWLETTTLEDFQELASNPKKFPWPTFSGFDNQFRELFYKALIERWLTLDPENGLQTIQKVQKEFQESERGGVSTSEYLLNIAAWLQPERVLQQLPLDNNREYLETHVYYALQALGKHDPKTARSYLDHFTTPEKRNQAERAIALGIVESNPLAAVSLSQQYPEAHVYYTALQAAARIGPGIVRQLVSAAGDKLYDHPDLPRLLLQYPDLGADLTSSNQKKIQNVVSEDLRRAADQMDSAERARVLENYDKLPHGVRDTLAAAVTCSWARTEPEKAAEWALAHAQPEDRAAPQNRAADQVFLRWVNTNPESALAWWRSLSPSPLRDALGSNASTYLAEQGQLDAALQMCRPQSGEEDSTITAHLTQYLVERDPAEAAAWLKDLPAELDTTKASRTVIEEWFPREPEAVARWIETLPAGARRDGAMSVFVEKASQHSPMGAAEWAETLTDPKLRQEATMQVYWALFCSDPGAAKEWVLSLRGLDPEWHARFIRRIK